MEKALSIVVTEPFQPRSAFTRLRALPPNTPDQLLPLPTFQQTCPEKFFESRAQPYSLRLVFLLHILFTAKSSAPLGFFCQSPCAAVRGAYQNRRRARFRALRLRSAPEMTAPPSAYPLANYETNVFDWPFKAQLSH